MMSYLAELAYDLLICQVDNVSTNPGFETICALLSGASEALSYTLVGARNKPYPSVYKEEEANLRD